MFLDKGYYTTEKDKIQVKFVNLGILREKRMKLAFVISEYNPFHCGHEYMIQKMREELGDVIVVAIMSTSFVQRGEPALFPYEVRARTAVECGADLVISLPVPYSMAGGSFFARAGVRIASTFLCDEKYLVFGSESGKIDSLSEIAFNMSRPEYIAALSDRSMDEPYAEAVVRIYRELYGKSLEDRLSQPNNILAIEYIRSISEEGSDLHPFTVKRVGSGYNDDSSCGDFLSATALRRLFYEGREELFCSKVPRVAADIYREAIENGNYSLGWEGLSDGVITFLRLSRDGAFSHCAEMSGGLDRRLVTAAHTVGTIEELFRCVSTKRFTNARIRRAILSALLSVTEADISAAPEYTMVLAANKKGTSALRVVDDNRINVVTKPSLVNTDSPSGVILSASEALYAMSLKNKRSTNDFMKITPYIKR